MTTPRAHLKNTTKLVVALFYFGASSLLLSCRYLLGPRKSTRLVILYYHGVGSEEREDFARQLDQLLGYSKIVSADYCAPADGPGLLTAITFDDAFSNLLDNAIPELNKRLIPASIFVPVGLIGKVPTWDMSAESRLESDCVMTEEQLSSLLSKGITLGSHTINHPRLSKLDDSEARGELRKSKEKLEEVFGVSVSGIAFPYGDYNQQTLEICREIGYQFAYSIEPEVIDPSNENLLRGRVAVNPTDSPLVFYLKSHGAYSWMSYVSKLKRFIVSRLKGK